ncbi:MAG: response regulator [Myxococcota bacterium]
MNTQSSFRTWFPPRVTRRDVVMPMSVVHRVEVWVMVVATALIGTFVLTVVDRPEAAWSGGLFAVVLALVLSIIAVSQRRASLTTRRRVLPVAVGLVSLAALFITGLRLGTGAGIMASTVLGALVYGRRAVVFAVAATAVSVATAATLFVSGAWTPVLAASTGSSGIEQVRIFGSTVLVLISSALVGETIMSHVGAMLEERARATAKRNREAAIAEGAATALAEARDREALGRLAGGVAHDVNNGLAVILLNARLLEEDVQGGGAASDRAASVIAAAERAAAATGALMSMARSNVGAIEEASVCAVMAAVKEAITPMLPVAFDVVIERDAVVVMSEGALQQAMLQVLIDGLDAMKGTAPIRVTLEVSDHEATVRLGRDSDGEQEAGSIDRRRLDVVARTLERRGGRLEVDDGHPHPVLRLVLPLAITNEDFKTASVAAMSSSGERPRPVVLVVDDEPAVRRAIGRILRSAGYDVVEARDGASAERAFTEHHVHLLLTDVVMPNTDTSALIDTFRRRYPGVPVIVCSGFVDQKRVASGIGAGHFAFIAKPFPPTELLDVVGRALAHEPEPAA